MEAHDTARGGTQMHGYTFGPPTTPPGGGQPDPPGTPGARPGGK